MEKVSDLPTDRGDPRIFTQETQQQMASCENAARWGFLLLKLEKTEPEMMQDSWLEIDQERFWKYLYTSRDMKIFLHTEKHAT